MPSSIHRMIRIYIRLGLIAGFAKVEVQDEGPGIPEHEINKLFSEFQKVSTRPTADEKSTGLGLAIVKKIIGAHGGKIGVESKVGQGSVFYFCLPMTV